MTETAYIRDTDYVSCAATLNEYIRCVRAIEDTLFAYLLTTQEPHALKLIAEINRHIDALPKVEEPQP